MILKKIRHYLKQREQASLNDIALHINAEKDAVQGMLEILIRRGDISIVNMTSACQSSCGECDSAITVLYLWGQQNNQSQEVVPDWS